MNWTHILQQLLESPPVFEGGEHDSSAVGRSLDGLLQRHAYGFPEQRNRANALEIADSELQQATNAARGTTLNK